MAGRPVWADVDLGAIRHIAATLADIASPAAVCAVVKADGYGHGSVPVAHAALEGGATWLAVAMASEGAVLRAAAIEAPILVLSEPSPAEMDEAVAAGLRPTLYSHTGVEELAKAVARAGSAPVAVHLKVDTGMRRVGVQPEEAVAVATDIAERPELDLEGIWTHCAVADEPGNPYTSVQLARFDDVLDELRAAGITPPIVHAANSAATLTQPGARRDLVRAGIALYGIDPSAALAGVAPLQPALSLRAHVSFVKEVAMGERISYGLRHTFSSDAVVATVPIGYADGVPRRLSAAGGEVLVGGHRRPIVGTITMDQLMVDCGPPGTDVSQGDEVVLIGTQGDDRIRAEEWADRLDTIGYEIVCGISGRVPRRYVG